MDFDTIEQIPLTGRRVLVRASLNVPLGSQGQVVNDYRLQQAVPTIRHAAERKAKVIIAGHLGRPETGVDPSLSLAPIARRLTHLLGRPVVMAENTVGPSVTKSVASMRPGDIVLLENLRFHRGETSNDLAFARELASFTDVYVNDAFSVSHREHASIVGVAKLCQTNAIGFLMQKEIEAFSRLRHHAPSPFVVILGGSKVKTKLAVISYLAKTCDVVLLGGLIGLTMLRAAGIGVGATDVEQGLLGEAKTVLAESRHARASVLSAKDHVVAERLDPGAPFRSTEGVSIPDGYVGCDIGPKTVEEFTEILRRAKTIFWNGPLGACEIPRCDRGTNRVAEAISEDASINVAGGGDTVAYLVRSGYGKSFSHLSTGGGAALEFLVQGDLPGLAALLH